MNSLILLTGLGCFISLFLLFLIALGGGSRGEALLKEVTRQRRTTTSGDNAISWRSLINAKQLAKGLSFFRIFLSREPDQDVTRRLLLAGYREPAHVDIFLGSKLALPAVLGILMALVITANTVVFFFLALIIGFFAPDFWLAHAIKRRMEAIKLSLPDGLDLLAICMEAGLGLDQAIVRVGQELRVRHPELSEELLQVNFEQRAGIPRMTAWKDFADRAGVESVRSFVGMLIQTDRFGTPISRSLSNFADALRTQRRQQAEEQAAKTTIKLVPPLALCIFPDVFIVTVGPAIILIMKHIATIVK
jgi:tight adherence protein C